MTLAFAVCGVAASGVIAWFHGQRGDQEAPLIEYFLLGGVAVTWLALSGWIVLAS